MRYWSLTLAVFTFYLFAVLVALADVLDGLREAARKKRAATKPAVLELNPMAGRTIAQTVFPGPGQQLDAKREWVAGLAGDIVRSVSPSVKILVLEDSKGHPLVHFSDGTRLETYRVDRPLVEAAMAGDTARVAEVKDLLTRHLMADFLGKESERPTRTTELAREAGAKPAPAAAARPAGPAAGAQTAPVSVAPAGPAAPTPTPPAPSAPAAPANEADMSREDRIAAARARADALRAQRQQNKPPG
jgi:hypothetical protein